MRSVVDGNVVMRHKPALSDGLHHINNTELFFPFVLREILHSLYIFRVLGHLKYRAVVLHLFEPTTFYFYEVYFCISKGIRAYRGVYCHTFLHVTLHICVVSTARLKHCCSPLVTSC